MQQTLRHLKSTIETLPSWPAAAPMEAAKKLSKKSGISVPWPTYLEPALKEVNWKVSFESPASVNVVGLWPCNMALKTKNSALEIELAVEMPTVSSMSFYTQPPNSDLLMSPSSKIKISRMDVTLPREPSTSQSFSLPCTKTPPSKSSP